MSDNATRFVLPAGFTTRDHGGSTLHALRGEEGIVSVIYYGKESAGSFFHSPRPSYPNQSAHWCDFLGTNAYCDGSSFGGPREENEEEIRAYLVEEYRRFFFQRG